MTASILAASAIPQVRRVDKAVPKHVLAELDKFRVVANVRLCRGSFSERFQYFGLISILEPTS